MSVHLIYYQQGHKMMEAVATEEAYRRYRDSQAQQRWVETIRHPKPETDVSAAKRKLVQFNYSCLPTEDGCLKGAKRLSKSVGMDIDHLSADEVNLVAATAIEKKDELGLLMLERSARGGGLHVVFRRHPEMDQETNLRWASDLLGVEYDAGAKDITRVFFATTSEDLLYLHEDLFDNAECEASTGSATATKATTKTATEAATTAPEATQKADRTNRYPMASVASEAASTASETVSETTGQNDGEAKTSDNQGEKTDKEASEAEAPLCYEGIPYDRIIKKWWDFYNEGKTPSKSNRNTLTFELAVNLRNICDSDPQLLNRIIPCYDEFPEAEKMACIRSALGEKNTQMPKRVKDVLTAVRQDMRAEAREEAEEEEALLQDDLYYYDALPKMPQGVRESIDAVGPYLAMPAIFAITPAIGMLATGVRVDIHGTPSQLNLISYIAGDFASGKGSIDPIVSAWLSEIIMADKGYLEAEEEWRARKRAAKNKKEQPEEPKYPVRYLTLNNTVANLADRLANTQGKHAFSFTPEADTVAQKWRTAMCDFSVMLRQAYDGTPYDREAKSADAVNVHIEAVVERRDVWHARRPLPRHHQLYRRFSESCGRGPHARQHLLGARGEPLPSDGATSGEDPASGPPAALDERRRGTAEAGEARPPVAGANPHRDAGERRQDQGAPALPHLPHGDAHDDLSDALSCGRAAHPAPRIPRSRKAVESPSYLVAGTAPAPADATDARHFRRLGRLHDRQRHLLLPRAYRRGVSGDHIRSV